MWNRPTFRRCMPSFLSLLSARRPRDRSGPLRKAVARFVFRMSVMTAHPLPGDTMDEAEPIQLGPQILILLTLPAEGHGLDQQLRIGMEYDGLGGRKGLQGLDGGHHFHAVIGGVSAVTRPLVSLPSLLNNDVGPASRARVPETAAIGVDLNGRGATHVDPF